MKNCISLSFPNPLSYPAPLKQLSSCLRTDASSHVQGPVVRPLIGSSHWELLHNLCGFWVLVWVKYHKRRVAGRRPEVARTGTLCGPMTDACNSNQLPTVRILSVRYRVAVGQVQTPLLNLGKPAILHGLVQVFSPVVVAPILGYQRIVPDPKRVC